ncbi:MAG: GNAT family N-acetyltransferase [Candidatus Kerfeldbacteria bacterium]|nr:GNAT family N-acetyltransferase [Candidatus Kerfeldbacteria bacterium]
MQIIKATLEHKSPALILLDEFRTHVMHQEDPNTTAVSTDAVHKGGTVYDEVVQSKSGAIFLAQDGDQYVGIVTIYRFPRVRAGTYYAEIEEMFVQPAYHGKGIAQQLVKAATAWAKENGAETITTKSGEKLARAHAFYQKMGFKVYGKAFKKQF